MGTTDDESRQLDKVVIELQDQACAVETLWAELVGDGTYRLRNVPILAYGFSEQDVVNTKAIAGRLIVTGIAQRGGHSTYRLFFSESIDEERFAPLWKPLRELGCTYERANTRIIGVDVPPAADVYAVYEALETGELANQWTFEEGHCGHRLRK